MMKKGVKEMEKVIVADCDGVLLNWEYAFDCWMNERGFFKGPNSDLRGFFKGPNSDLHYEIGNRYGLTKQQGKNFIAEFNQSAAIGFLPALRDAVWYVKRLHEEHGYVFDVVTSLSTDKHDENGISRRFSARTLFVISSVLLLVLEKISILKNTTKIQDTSGLKIR
jgi:FMN phosphatase YigB (HAD superfamily)